MNAPVEAALARIRETSPRSHHLLSSFLAIHGDAESLTALSRAFTMALLYPASVDDPRWEPAAILSEDQRYAVLGCVLCELAVRTS